METLLAKDPEYSTFVVAKSMAQEDEKIRKQAAMFAEAIQGPIQKMTAEVAALQYKPARHVKPPTTTDIAEKQSEPEEDENISKRQAAWIEAIFGFAFKISPGMDWAEVAAILKSKMEDTKSSWKNLDCIKCFSKFLDRQEPPRHKTPKTGREKAELLIKK